MTKKERTKHIIVLLLLSYTFFFHGIGNYSLKEPDEGRYAEIPREMNELRDYVVPHLNYVRYFEKPPLLYWINAVSFRLFGTNEWAVRFPNAFCAFLCVIFLYFFASRWFNPHMAFLSSIILISSFGFFTLARIVTTDMLFTASLFLSLLFFYEFYRDKKPFSIYLYYITLAAATLAKGPVALILMGGTILTFLFTERNLRFITEIKILRGLVIYLMITLPWLIAISTIEKEFLYFFFVDQHILRFLTSKHHRSGPIYYFLPVLFGGMFPWSVFIPRAVANALKNKELRLMLIWSTVILAFFSFSGSKLPPYILPVFPPMAMVLGYLFYDKWQIQVSGKWEVSCYLLFFLVFGVTGLLTQIPNLNSHIRNIAGEYAAIIKDIRLFLLWLAFASFIVIYFLVSRKSADHARLFILLSSFSLAFMLGILFNLNTVDRLKTTKELAMMINTQKTKADYIINYSSFNPAIPFYINKGVTVITNYAGELEMGSKYEDAKKRFISLDDFMKLLPSEKKVLFLARQKRIENLRQIFPERIRIQGCQNDRCLATNF